MSEKVNNKETRKKYEYLLRRVSKLKHELYTANTGVDVSMALNRLSSFMSKEVLKEERLTELAEDIVGTIRAVQLCDATRSVLDDLLQELLQKLNAIIKEEIKKQNASKMRKLFQAMADHAEEIADMVDINNIFN